MATSDSQVEATNPRASASTLAPQETDSARTPREGDASSPTDLVRILKDLRKEGVIVPSRQFMQMIQAERKVEAKTDFARKEESKKDEKKDEAQSARVRGHLEDEVFMFRSENAELADHNPFRSCPPLLTILVENVLEYCRTKLLDEELDALSLDGTGPAGRSAAAERAAQRRARVAMLLRRCTETYGQLLLVYSEKKPSTKSKAAGRVAEAAAAAAAAAESPAEGSPTPRSRSKAQMDDDGHASTRSRSAFLADNKSPRSRERSPVVGLIHPTPFFEAVYALLARAVQQGMRAAAEGSRIAQEKGGMAQLAARVDEELGRLFRSREFGQSSGRGIRKGGAKVDAGSGTEGVESAQLAARAEAELGKLIKTASQLTSRLNLEFRALEETLHRHPATETKQSADQADKSPPADSKEAANAAGDHAATAASVDALITWFKSRAPPRQRHADQNATLAHVISTRSPMINSLLPSPHDQALDLERLRREYRHRPHRLARSSSRNKKLNGEIILNSARSVGSSTSTRGGFEEKIDSSRPVLQNTWALSQERTLHRPASSAPPIFNSRTLVAFAGGSSPGSSAWQ